MLSNRNFFCLIIVVLILCGFPARGENLGLIYTSGGGLTAGPFNILFSFTDTAMKSTRMEQGFQVAESQDGRDVSFREGEFTPKSVTAVPFALRSEMKWELPNKGVLSFIATKKSMPIEANRIGARIELPFSLAGEMALSMDGKSFNLLDAKSSQWFGNPRKVQKLQIDTAAGTYIFSGPIRCTLQDGRAYKIDSALLFLWGDPEKGKLDRSEIHITVEYRPNTFQVLNLSTVANRTLADEVAGDGRGGWTDQGPDRDMHMLPTGEGNWEGIPYTLATKGNQVLVLKGPGATDNPSSANLTLDGRELSTLFLLHDTAWTPNGDVVVGHIIVTDVSGKEYAKDVVIHQEVGDWIAPVAQTNGEMLWKGKGPFGQVGVFISRFDFPNVKARSIRFESTGQAQWLILGATASPQTVLLPHPVNIQSIVQTDNKWRPLKYTLDIAPDSALDFSWMADAPAGKHGRVLFRGNNCVFEDQPNKPIRFFGVNLSFSATWPDKATADRVALRFKMMGYNAVRLAHLDRDMYKPDSRQAEAEVLDRVHYFCSALKRNGIYVVFDIYFARRFSSDLIEIPGYEKKDQAEARTQEDFKSLLPINTQAMQLWKEQVEQILLSPNPYTGMPLAKDPALIAISLVNEDSLVVKWDRNPKIAQRYRLLFEEWLRDKDTKPVSTEDRQALLYQFLVSKQNAEYQEMRDYLKKLGVDLSVTGCNYGCEIPTMWTREQLDYVDNHSYWNHPRFPKGLGRLPYLFTSESVIKSDAKTPREIFPTRVFGRPFFVTEFNYCYPNPNRAEGGPIMGAYASFQNWTAIFHFAYAHKTERLSTVSAPVGFEISADPINTLSDRIISLLFLRGDVSTAKTSLSHQLPANGPTVGLTGTYPLAFSRLGLVTALGTLSSESSSKVDVTSIKLPVDDTESVALAEKIKVLPGGSSVVFNPKEGDYVSDTGQIMLSDKKPSFRCITPKSETFAVPGKGMLSGEFVTVQNQSEEATTVAVLSIDSKPLRESKRLLLLHLTNVEATGTTYGDESHTIMEKWGSLPHLVRSGTVELKTPKPVEGIWAVYALNPDGSRAGKLAVQTNRLQCSMILDVNATAIPTLAYEMVRE